MDRRRRDDRGSTLVEAAFVMPVFILMIFGIIEFSGVVMTKTGTNSAVKSGSRMAVVSGNDAMADRNILLRMAKDGSGISQDHINQIIIWRASSPSEAPPSACVSANSGFHPSTGASHCNVYNDPQDSSQGAFHLARLPAAVNGDPPNAGNSDYYFGCLGSADPNASVKRDCGWPPQNRRILEQSPTYTCSGGSDPKCQPTDLVGIYMKVTHRYYTGFFGSTVVVTNRSVSAIEPQGYDK